MNVQVNGTGQVPVRRLAGIDLGIASEHTVRVLDGAGNKVCAARCVPARESLLAMEARALAGTPPGTRLEVILEPAGAAWFPVARFLAAATRCTGCPRRRPLTCVSSTGGMPRATGSTPRRWRGCRWPPPAG